MPPDWLESNRSGDPVWTSEESVKPRPDHPEYHSKIRWVVLFLSCWIMFGNYYAFDNPSALNRPLRGILAPVGEDELFQYRLSLLYSLYSVPNVVLPFFVGRWLDRLGSRAILLLLSFLVAAGQLLVAYGLQTSNFSLVVTGRVLFGIGGESLAVAQSRLVTQWFAGKELALAIGLNLSIARVGTVVNNVLSPLVADRWSVSAAFWVGFLSCLLSFCCTVATIVVDRCYHHYHSDHEHAHKHPSSRRRTANHDFDQSFWILATICFLFYVSSLSPS
jgi:MFS family permease